MDKKELDKNLKAISNRDTNEIHRWTLEKSAEILKNESQKEEIDTENK